MLSLLPSVAASLMVGSCPPLPPAAGAPAASRGRSLGPAGSPRKGRALPRPAALPADRAQALPLPRGRPPGQEAGPPKLLHRYALRLLGGARGLRRSGVVVHEALEGSCSLEPGGRETWALAHDGSVVRAVAGHPLSAISHGPGGPLGRRRRWEAPFTLPRHVLGPGRQRVQRQTSPGRAPQLLAENVQLRLDGLHLVVEVLDGTTGQITGAAAGGECATPS